METTLCPSTDRVKQSMYKYTMEYHIPIKYKERLIHATKWIMFSGGPHTLYFHLYDILAKVNLGTDNSLVIARAKHEGGFRIQRGTSEFQRMLELY